MSCVIRKLLQDQSGKTNQEVGNVVAFSLIILSVAGALCYGLQHGMLNKMNEQSTFVASHASEHMY